MSRVEEFSFSNDRGQSLSGRLERASGQALGVAIFAHCFTCSKNVSAATRISRGLAACGYTVLRFDFTGLGNSEGDFANTNFSSNVADLVAASRALEEREQAPTLLVGHSLGGAAVLAAAGRIDSVRAVATIGAPSDPAHVTNLFASKVPAIDAEGSAEVVLAGRPFRIEKQFLTDVAEQKLAEDIGALKRALLVLHSPVDELVSVDHAAAIYRAAKHPKSFVSLDDADHLLTRTADANYVADLLSAWARKYVAAPVVEQPPITTKQGEVAVHETGAGYQQRIVAGEHEFLGDEPASVGGLDTGPTPYDYLLAALGTCTSMTLRMYADRKGWPVEDIAVRLEHDRIHAKDCEDCNSESGLVDRIRRTITFGGTLDDAQTQRLLDIANRCPVHRTLHNEIKVVDTFDSKS